MTRRVGQKEIHGEFNRKNVGKNKQLDWGAARFSLFPFFYSLWLLTQKACLAAFFSTDFNQNPVEFCRKHVGKKKAGLGKYAQFRCIPSRGILIGALFFCPFLY